MFSIAAYAWLIAGGVLEPMWVLAMKRSGSFRDPLWTAATVVLVVASPFCLSVAMNEVPVGTAYAIWTGIGAVGTVILGLFLYKERAELKRLFFITLIIVGAVGLAIGGV
ncbi:MAG: multidrug efflux SMR transporter [Candidatus Methanoplasma sp.]|jgi:quaternary ammonium compound-resistance protein SugE|nr:multidrug efflux SMR transporter [Candidatus Methanoplasma sp.]